MTQVKENSPEAISNSILLCCQNDLKGAMPVPGPTIMTGSEGSSGSWKAGALQRKLKRTVSFNLIQGVTEMDAASTQALVFTKRVYHVELIELTSCRKKALRRYSQIFYTLPPPPTRTSPLFNPRFVFSFSLSPSLPLSSLSLPVSLSLSCLCPAGPQERTI